MTDSLSGFGAISDDYRNYSDKQCDNRNDRNEKDGKRPDIFFIIGVARTYLMSRMS